MNGQTYTEAEVAALTAEAVRDAIREINERRAQGYREGIAGEGAICGAVAPRTGVECQREPGHPLGPLDRHKAVFGEPHEAVVWN